jgi:hypothetical protein
MELRRGKSRGRARHLQTSARVEHDAVLKRVGQPQGTGSRIGIELLMPPLHQTVFFEYQTDGATQFSPSNDSDFDRAECLCEIPLCLGHDDKGGFIEIPRLVAQLFLGLDELGSDPLS